MRNLLLVVIILVAMSAVVGAALHLMGPTAPATPITTPLPSTTVPTSTPTATISTTTTPVKPTPTTTQATQPSGLTKPIITDVVPMGFVLVDGEVYWRVKVLGTVDLRDKIEINGVYAFWFGRFKVTLPDGREQTRLFMPGDYVNIVRDFRYIREEMTLDVYIPTNWYENPCLEGTYRFVVWLQGPYENRSLLFDKSFVYKMNLKANISPTELRSWSENLKLSLTNTGDVPLILQGVGIERTGTGTVVGWVLVPEEIIMPNESKELTAPVQILNDFREEFKGKTITVDFVLNVVAAPQRYAITADVRFPAG
ncbi:MAG: hypothetical protein QXX81_02080 [Zestosphaera sp.]